LREILGWNQHQVDSWLRLGLGAETVHVFVRIVLRFGSDARLVRTFLVRVQQCTAVIQAQTFVGGPARPLGTHRRVRAAPVAAPLVPRYALLPAATPRVRASALSAARTADSRSAKHVDPQSGIVHDRGYSNAKNRRRELAHARSRSEARTRGVAAGRSA